MSNTSLGQLSGLQHTFLLKAPDQSSDQCSKARLSEGAFE
ncbi:hypothetical protein SynNOUM97013_01524 [Synechococcus sp. NOUM97013]|nr:hypothetical protein SynNOUM97013_01524 [Synechococcus sp. NOUM97013]